MIVRQCNLSVIKQKLSPIDFRDFLDVYSPTKSLTYRYNSNFFCFYTDKTQTDVIGIIVIDIPKEINNPRNPFIDIFIRKQHRGKGYSSRMYKMIEPEIKSLLYKSGRKCLSATVSKTNTPSIRFLKSVGFKEYPKDILDILIHRNVLTNKETRLYKCY